MSLIHLFKKCNQKCLFCSYPSETETESATTLKDWLKEIAAMSPGLVQISGGEPLLADFDELLKLIAFCAREGRQVELQSNALILAQLPERKLKLLVTGLHAAHGYFNINFPAPDPALDYKITGVKNGFSLRVKGVKKILKLGAQVRLTFVISRLNYKVSAKFAAYAAKYLPKVSWLQFSFIKGIGRAEGGLAIPKYSQAAPPLLTALELCKAANIKCEVDHIPLCFLGRLYHLNVDVRKMRLKLKGPHLNEKKKIAACRGCKHAAICPGPRKDYVAVYGGL